MSTDPSITDLLRRYEELRCTSRPATPEEVCWDCPQLIHQLKRHLLVLGFLEGLGQVLGGGQGGPGAGARGRRPLPRPPPLTLPAAEALTAISVQVWWTAINWWVRGWIWAGQPPRNWGGTTNEAACR